MIERDKDGWPVLKAGMLVSLLEPGVGSSYRIISRNGGELRIVSLPEYVEQEASPRACDSVSTDEGKTWHKYEQVTKPESPERIFVNHYEECIPAVHETHDAAVLAAGRDCTDIAREYVRADKVLPWGKGEGKAEERSVVLEIFPSGTVSAWTAQAGYDLTSARNRVYHIPISAILATLPKEGK